MNTHYKSDLDLRANEKRYLAEGKWRCEKDPRIIDGKPSKAHFRVCYAVDGLVSYYRCKWCGVPNQTVYKVLPEMNEVRRGSIGESIEAQVRQIALRCSRRAA